MKKLHLDNGMDLPTIFRAYLDVIDEEFDFKIEHEKIDYFGKLFEQTPEICDKVCAPQASLRLYEESFSHATRSRREIADDFQSGSSKRKTSALSATSFPNALVLRRRRLGRRLLFQFSEHGGR